MPRVEQELSQPREPKIALTSKLTFNAMLDGANEGIKQGRSGFLLLFFLKNGARGYRPAAIEFFPRVGKRSEKGFWLHDGNSGGSTLEYSAVVLDSEDKSMTFVNAGPDNKTVSGIKIDCKRHAEEFSGPAYRFPKIILDAKKKASDYCKKEFSLKK
jgi:hypothetical protein